MLQHPCNILPNTLSHLTFNIAQPIANLLLPNSLTHLIFGDAYDQPLSCLPSSITHLNFGKGFNHPLANLPSSLKHLKLGASFNQSIGLLPLSLVSLECFYSEAFESNNTLLILLPPQLQSFHLLCLLDSLNSYPNIRSIIIFPASLIDLILEVIPMKLPVFPPQLQHLKVCVNSYSLKDQIPASVTSLEYTQYFSTDDEPPLLPPQSKEVIS